MNEGNWTEVIWLKTIVKAAIKEVYNIVSELKKQESTNSKSIEDNAKTYRDEIMTGLEGVQNLFKSSGEVTLEPKYGLAGKTYWDGLTLKTGTMPNKAGTTVKATAQTDDGENLYLTVPVAGYFDETSKIYTSDRNVVYDLGTYTEMTEIYISGIPGYEKLTRENFIVNYAKIPAISKDVNLGIYTTDLGYDTEYINIKVSNMEPNKTYNASEGRVTIYPRTKSITLYDANGKMVGNVTQTAEIHVYLVIGDVKTL